MATIAYGIQLLEKEPHNAADRYHSNQHHKPSDCIASNRKSLTTHYYNELLKKCTPRRKIVVFLIFKYQQVIRKYLNTENFLILR